MKISTITAATLVLAFCLIVSCGCTTMVDTNQQAAVAAPRSSHIRMCRFSMSM